MKAALHKSSNLMKEVKMDEEEGKKTEAPQKSIASQRAYLHYIFPDLEIIPLHLIRKYEDIAANRIRVSL